MSDKAKLVLEHLNKRTGHNYRAVKSTIHLITSRLKEGATVAEMQQVIDHKANEWKGDDRMKQYLRPKTLFCAQNYDSYSGSLSNVKKEVRYL